MTTAIQPAGGNASGGAVNALADVIDTILDKGLVIDAYVRVSLVGIEVLTIDARIVVASVDTYLRFAEAVNRLDIAQSDPKSTLPDVVGDVTEGVTHGASKGKTSGVLEAAGEKLGDILTEKQPQRQKVRSRREDR
jgi:gas vesicle structural protein